MNDFIVEQPLHYAEALSAVRKFETQYQISTEQMLKNLAESKADCIAVDPDDLYEWRTYYDFVARVDAKLQQLLGSNVGELGEADLVYSSADPNCTRKPTASQKNQELSLAA